MATKTETEMYITGINYQGSTWTNFAEDLFELIDYKLREITCPDLSYWEHSVNKTENWVMSSSTARQELLSLFKNIVYDNSTLLTETQIGELRTKVINKLDELDSDITYSDVEARTNKIWY